MTNVTFLYLVQSGYRYLSTCKKRGAIGQFVYILVTEELKRNLKKGECITQGSTVDLIYLYVSIHLRCYQTFPMNLCLDISFYAYGSHFIVRIYANLP
jgi:hypothetical protein